MSCSTAIWRPGALASAWAGPSNDNPSRPPEHRVEAAPAAQWWQNGKLVGRKSSRLRLVIRFRVINAGFEITSDT
jgi:hypothetical protein